MANLFVDSFDYYTLAQLLRKWTAGNCDQLGVAYGRNGTSGIRCVGNFANIRNVIKNLPVNAPRLFVGAALRKTAAGDQTMIQLMDNGTIQLEVRGLASGAITVLRGGGAVLGTTAPGVLTSTLVHDFIEVGGLIDPAAGELVIRVNNIVKLNLAGLNTRQTANSYINQVHMGARAFENGTHIDVDDVYVNDDTGPAPHNGFYGDIHWRAKRVTAAGSSTQFVANGAPSNWEAIDDATADDDATHNASSTIGHKDLFAAEDEAAPVGSIIGVALNAVDRKLDAGVRTHDLRIKQGPDEVAGAAYAPTVAYVNHQTFFPAKAGGGAWTIADWNATEIGYSIAT